MVGHRDEPLKERSALPVPRALLPIVFAALAVTPALLCRLLQLPLYDTAPLAGLLVYGTAIIGAAFLLTWGAELAELEMPPNLALVLLALVAVLPEYAVDIYLAWSAGVWAPPPGAAGDQLINVKQGLALANMTGGNRLLIGLGWPLILLVSWWRLQRPVIQLDMGRSVDLLWLGVITAYTLVIPLKGTLTIVDTLILLTLYGIYLYNASRVPSRERQLEGPAEALAHLTRGKRIGWTWGLFLFAAAGILLAAHPFTESLIHVGQQLGISEFFLIQWLAPLASESPELLAVSLLAARGHATDGLGALLSGKVNQWSLLVGMIPLAFAFGHLHAHQGWQGGFVLDARQTEELVLTSAQSLYGLSTVMSYRFRLGDAFVLLGLFLLQIIGTVVLEQSGQHGLVAPWHYALSAVYVLLGVLRILQQRRYLKAIWRGARHLDEATWEAAMRGGTPAG